MVAAAIYKQVIATLTERLETDAELARLRTDHDEANAVYEARVNIRNEALERLRHSRA